MWLLTTRNRPDLCQQALDTFEEKAVGSPGIVWCDGCSYPYLRLPVGWEMIETKEPVGLSWPMNWLLYTFPAAPWYGWYADDFMARTKHFDEHLIEAARAYRIAYCNDIWNQERRADPAKCITSAFVVGGDLVRAIGWFAPPKLRQAFIDRFWNQIGALHGVQAYLDHVIVEHMHWKNGKRPRDETDNVVFDDETDAIKERKLWDAFRSSGELGKAHERAREFLKAQPGPRHSDPDDGKIAIIHDSRDIPAS